MCDHDMDHLPFTAPKHCRHCGKSEQELELEAKLAAANARVAELSDEYNHKCRVAQSWFEKHNDALQRAERAEAQCAETRLQFEQYARNKCKLVAQFGGKLGMPEFESGKCQGYAMSEHDDEPHYFCQECPACLHNDDEKTDTGTALLEENRRMREALEKARPALVRADSDTSYIAHRYSHVLKNANCPLTEDELLKTSGLCREAAKLAQQALKGGA